MSEIWLFLTRNPETDGGTKGYGGKGGGGIVNVKERGRMEKGGLEWTVAARCVMPDTVDIR